VWTDQLLLDFAVREFQMKEENEENRPIKVLFKEGCSGKKIHPKLKTAYGATCYAKRTVFSWMQRIRKAMESDRHMLSVLCGISWSLVVEWLDTDESFNTG
jgi:G:T-mismatch repair DNA endonuclease (very short patch repair protein)